MTTSPSHSLLSKPSGESPISERSLGYATGSARLDLHELVLEAFQEAGISQATLAKRLRKRPEQISRILAGPGNWTIDTVAELLFAIDGSLLRAERRWPDFNWQSNQPTHLWSSATATDTRANRVDTGSSGQFKLMAFDDVR